MDKITIADCTFLQYVKSLSVGGNNSHVCPSFFEWEMEDPQKARFVTDSFIKDARGEGQVALLLESFFLHPENYLAAMEKPFDHVLTHNHYFSENKGWFWYPKGGSWVGFSDWKIYDKNRNVSVILSDKNSMPGHKLFHAVVEKYGYKFDNIFGLQGRVGKLEGLAPFRYSVVVEAERCPYFFSEKLIDCLAVGTIPIYWGCPEIGKFFDARGILEVKSIDNIGEVLDMVIKGTIIVNQESVKNNFGLAKQYRIAEDWIYKEYPFLFQ